MFQLADAPTAASLRERLVESALLLRKRIRTYDDVGVVADNTLAVLLPETTGQDTWVFVDGAIEELRAERLEATCEVYTYPHSDHNEGDEPSAHVGDLNTADRHHVAKPGAAGNDVASTDLDRGAAGMESEGPGNSETMAFSAESASGTESLSVESHSADLSTEEAQAHSSPRWMAALGSTAVMERPTRLRVVARDASAANPSTTRASRASVGASRAAFAGSSALASVTLDAPAPPETWVRTTQRREEAQAAPRTQSEVRPIRDLAPYFEESLPLHRRAVDIVVAGSALAALSPVLLVSAALVKLTSPGPIIFAQERAGRGGRPFQFYKLRSMYQDAEERKSALRLVNEKDGPIFKIKNDPRITPVGKVLRKFSIDELPQLFNVLRGDMTLVGPRPPVMDEVKEYEPWQRQRLDITGGITCIWQVSGRSEVTFREWMRMDVRYRKQRSLKLDLKLVAKTFGAVFSGKGAY
ncbi:MAG: sugar transferase [Planctomycetota bacterium]